MQLGPEMILGFTSTTLITSQLFYSVPAVSIIDALIKLTEDPLLHVSAKQFKENFYNIILFVDSVKDLCMLCKKYRSYIPKI